MFDQDVSDLDAAEVADRLLASTRAVMAAEAEQLVLATQWADLHAPDFVADCEALAPGAEGTKRLGGDGCPELSEFAGAELAVYLGRTTASGEALIADAVNLRHRHPLLWRALRQGEVRVWLATKVARRCAAVRLSAEQALWVDAQVMPSMNTLPPGRFLALVEAKIVEADPVGAKARAEAEELARFVRAGRADEHGLRTLVARARGGDVLVLIAVLDRLAFVLADQGDTDPLEVRRATALRILADPARALALLAGSALEHLEDEATEEADASRDRAARRRRSGLGVARRQKPVAVRPQVRRAGAPPRPGPTRTRPRRRWRRGAVRRRWASGPRSGPGGCSTPTVDTCAPARCTTTSSTWSLNRRRPARRDRR